MSINMLCSCSLRLLNIMEQSGEQVTRNENIKIKVDDSIDAKGKVARTEAVSINSDDFELLQISKDKIRSKSLPVELNAKNPKTGEWSQKLSSPLSLSKIHERLHKPHSVLEDSFLMGEERIKEQRKKKEA